MNIHATILPVKSDLKAMVVDDDHQVCGLVSEILRSEGWSVLEAHSHGECIELLPTDSWDLIFCDVILGDNDGYAILKHFREQNFSGRFVLMTGQGSAAGAARCHGNGCIRLHHKALQGRPDPRCRQIGA